MPKIYSQSFLLPFLLWSIFSAANLQARSDEIKRIKNSFEGSNQSFIITETVRNSASTTYSSGKLQPFFYNSFNNLRDSKTPNLEKYMNLKLENGTNTILWIKQDKLSRRQDNINAQFFSDFQPNLDSNSSQLKCFYINLSFEQRAILRL